MVTQGSYEHGRKISRAKKRKTRENKKKEELVAMVKFRFGKEENVFSKKFDVEYRDNYAYIFKKSKKKLKKVL